MVSWKGDVTAIAERDFDAPYTGTPIVVHYHPSMRMQYILHVSLEWHISADKLTEQDACFDVTLYGIISDCATHH